MTRNFQSCGWRTEAAAIVAVTLLVGSWGLRAAQADPWRAWLWRGVTCGRVDTCAKDCCPDNYCPKPIPGVREGVCTVCDKYCPKPIPCVKEGACTVCDDYCRKPIPTLCCPPCEPYYQCGPGSWCMPGLRPVKKE